MGDDTRRRAARYRIEEAHPQRDHRDDPEASELEAGRDRRLEAQSFWVEQQIRAAIERGDFDNLRYAGKPLPESVLGQDPDWWLKQLLQREQLTGLLPPAIQLRKDDAELDATVDRLGSERQVREEVTAFNRRVIEARRQLLGGPPVVTAVRDVDEEVAAWRARAAERRQRAAERAAEQAPPAARPRRWFRRR